MPSVLTSFWADRRPKIIEMRSRGKPLSYMAAVLGVTRGQVSSQIHQMKRAGIIAEPLAPNTKVCFTAEMDETLRSAIASGISFKDFAAQSGLSETVIQRRARDLDLRSAHKRTVDHDAIRPTLQIARDMGKTWRAIGVELGVSSTLVRRAARDMGIKTKGSRENRSDVKWSAAAHETLIALSLEGRTVDAIAEVFRTTRGAVSGQISTLRRAGRLPPVDIEKLKASRAAALARIIAERPKAEKLPAKPKLPRPARLPRPKVEKLAPAPELKRPVVDRITEPFAAMCSFVAAAGSGISIFDLCPSSCRWPLSCDDGETRYCGELATDGSWCAAHGARAFAGIKRPDVDAEYVPMRGSFGFAFHRKAA